MIECSETTNPGAWFRPLCALIVIIAIFCVLQGWLLHGQQLQTWINGGWSGRMLVEHTFGFALGLRFTGFSSSDSSGVSTASSSSSSSSSSLSSSRRRLGMMLARAKHCVKPEWPLMNASGARCNCASLRACANRSKIKSGLSKSLLLLVLAFVT